MYRIKVCYNKAFSRKSLENNDRLVDFDKNFFCLSIKEKITNNSAFKMQLYFGKIV